MINIIVLVIVQPRRTPSVWFLENNCGLKMVKYLKYLLSPFNSNFNSNMSKVLVNYSTLVVEVEKQKDDILLSEPKIQKIHRILLHSDGSKSISHLKN